MSDQHNDNPSLSKETAAQGDDASLAEGGLSLDELSSAYAETLQQGENPFQSKNSDVSAKADDYDEDDREPVDDDCEITPRSILEAMLFVGHPSNEPLASKQIAPLMRGVRPQEIDELVNELNQQYETEQSPYLIESVGAGYRLILREELNSLRNQFYRRVKEARLSQAAIDVLSVVAYHQPVTRQEVEKYRDKESGRLLRQLVRRDLLRIDGFDEHSRTASYATTDRFLNLFGLDGLDDLPHSQDLDKSP